MPAYDCEIQARLRDVNLGGHVDNVEALRVVDEARILFLRYARLGDRDGGALRDVPHHVAELMGSQRVDYHSEMRFVAYQPFLIRLWVSHLGRSSFAVSAELRVEADHPPALSSESTLVLWDRETAAPWPMSADVRRSLEQHAGRPVALRERPAT
jgi:acyl-CoA thioester hydrolase